MTSVVHFNVGGKQFEVSHSLLKMHPDCLLAQSASEQGRLNPEDEVVLEKDGTRFRFVLDYLRDGHVILPMTVAKLLFLADLAYYEIKNVDESKIVCHYGSDSKALAQIEKEISTKISDVLKDWDIHCSIVHLAKECASRYLSSGGKLQISIHGPSKNHPKQEGTVWCSGEAWVSFLLLFCDGWTRICCHAQEECNQYLAKVGLKIYSLKASFKEYAIQVSMKQTNI